MHTGFIHLSAPITVQFEVTYQCTNACEFCYNFRRTRPRMNFQLESSLNEKKRILRDLSFSRVYSIVFTGGEPFLYSDFLTLIEYAKNLGFIVHINTNGTLINKLTASFLRKINIDGILIALQSDKPPVHDHQTNIEGSWNNTIKGIKNLLEQNINVGINMTVTKNNYKYIVGVSKLAHDFGVSFSITRFIPINKQDSYLELSNSDLKKIIISLEKIKEVNSKTIKILTPFPLCSLYRISNSYPNAKCTAGLTWCAIAPNLDVRPCSFTSEIIGNLKNNKFLDIWNSEKMKRFQNLNDNPTECLKCKLLNYCLGGCRQLIKVHGKDPLIFRSMQLKNISLPHHEIKKIKLSMIFLKNPVVKSRKENFGMTLISSSSNFILIRGETAIFIWNQIDGKKDIKTILSNILNRYKVSIKEAKKDMIEFLSELNDSGFIQEVNLQ